MDISKSQTESAAANCLSDIAGYLSSLWSARSTDAILRYTQTTLQALLPHQLFGCVVASKSRPLDQPPIALVARAMTYDRRVLPDPERFVQLFASRLNTSGHVEALDVFQGIGDAAARQLLLGAKLSNAYSMAVRSANTDGIVRFVFFDVDEGASIAPKAAVQFVVPHLYVALGRVLTHSHSASASSNDIIQKQPLTPKEHIILNWVGRGKTNSEIAAIEGVSPKTVKNQVQSILVKLRVNNRAQAIATALAKGVITLS